MLENIQSYITASAQSSTTFNEFYVEYMMRVQDNHLDQEMSRLFSSPSMKKMIELDREANKLHQQMLKGNCDES